jgi:Xaa-Pro aminopeptidase
MITHGCRWLASTGPELDPDNPGLVSARGTGQMLDPCVPRSLLEERWRAVWHALEERGYEALLIAGRGMIMHYGNVYYFGGYPLFLFHGYVLITPGEQPSLVLNGRDQDFAADYGVGDLVWRTSGGDDVAYGIGASEGLARPISDLLSRHGLDSARIGVVGLGEIMPASEYRALCARLPNLVIEAADELNAGIKAIKSGRELELQREAVAIADDAFSLFQDLIKPGANELDIVAEVERAVRSQGVLHTIIRVLPSPMDARTPIARNLVANELNSAIVEIVAPNGFWVEKGACFALGDIPARSQEVYDASDRAFQAIEGLLTAGTPVSESARAVADVAQEAACPIGLRIGHGVGIDHDLPMIDPDNMSLLEEGMTIAIHPLFQDGPSGAFMIDQYTITRSAPLLHSRFPRQLYRV